MRQLTKDERDKARKANNKSEFDKSRKENTLSGFVSILIVCEGEETEFNYFKTKIDDRHSKVMSVKVKGEGKGTVSLIKKTKKIKDNSVKGYDSVWAVFDKDDFKDFNDAIKLAKKHEIQCAWSNESFELWYCLHFDNLNTVFSRSQYTDKLEKEIKKITKDKNYKYEKNDLQMYSRLKELGDEDKAISRAKKLEESYNDSNYNKHNPCTMVYKLVEELNNPEKLIYK